MKIKSTAYPEKPLSESEWMKEFNVGKNIPKYEGRDRARMMMNQWIAEGNEDGFREMIKHLKVPDLV